MSVNSQTMEDVRSEIFLGIVAPVGVNLDQIIELMTDYLKQFSYTQQVIRLSDLIPKIKGVKVKIQKSNEYKRIDAGMTAGNQARSITGQYDILARHSILSIQKFRGSQPKKGTAYIFRSIKHPEEVAFYRQLYGKGFFLLGFSSSREEKLGFLARKGMTEKEASYLIKRDEIETDPFGQHTRDVFHTSDAFFDVDRDSFQSDLKRFFNLIFGHPYLTPSKDEFGMFLAFSSSFRSGDLSRQVGAVISSAQGEIIAAGFNDVPRFGGGLYTCDDGNDQRDFVKGYDSNKQNRDEIADQIISVVETVCALGAARKEKIRNGLKDTRLFDITEYGRVVHAEMETLLSCARSGVTPRDGTLYSTTFPCHNCAKHIVVSGIKRVVFVEPYPKSKALDLHSDAICLDTTCKCDNKVVFQPFIGIGPRRFIDLFSLHLHNGVDKKRQRDGKIIKWTEKEGIFRFPILGLSYLDKETSVGAALARGKKNG